MKSTAIQALVLVGASVVVALVYNALSSDPLPLVREEPKVVSDAELFGSTQPEVPNEHRPDTVGGRPGSDTLMKVPNVSDNAKEVDIVKKAENTPPPVPDKPVREPAAAGTQAKAEVDVATVTYEQMVRLVKDPDVMFIDARNAEEYGAGHIRDAKNIYAPDFEQYIPEVISLPRSKRIIVYCGGGACELSHEVAAHLRNFGFEHVYVYAGGWNEWTRKQGKQ